ncbi:MAG TPA: hypothetical protein PKO06_21615, partial [Candidatus Ozemobacteraceae bacterium]|nr:hypothetical protein [Candidatus Ozemobacteraceae bacterium]
MHANLTLDRKYNFFNYAHTLKNSKHHEVVALSHVRFGVDGIPETREALFLAGTDPNGPNQAAGMPATDRDMSYTPGRNVYIFSYFDDTETATFGTYARKIGKQWFGGVNLKSLRQDLFTNSADSWGLDLGFLYTPNQKSAIGLSIRDIAEQLKWDTASGHSDTVPVTTTVGASYKTRPNMTVAVDVSKTQDLDAKFRVGTEYWFKDIAALRLGSQAGDLTLGASFKLQDWRFDYAYADETLGEAHRISASKQF